MRHSFLCAVALIAAMAPVEAAAAVWRAGEWSKIQEAIDSAAYGDTVLVAPGKYDRLIIRSGIHLLAENGPEETFLQNGRHWVIKADGVDSSAVVEGFTLDGRKSAEGVIYAENSQLRVVDCVMQNAWSGVRSLYSQLRIENCTFTQCQNGIYMFESEGFVTGCDIQLSVQGINLVSSSPRISRSTITRNSYGIIVTEHSDPQIGGSIATANKIWNNAAGNIRNDAYLKKSALRTNKLMTLQVPMNNWGTDCPDEQEFIGLVVWSPWVNEAGTQAIEDCEASAK